MAGNKNSGRRVKSVERLRDEVTIKSYNNIIKALDSKKMTTKEKADLANKIVCKDIGRKLGHSGEVAGSGVNVVIVKPEQKEAEVKTGGREIVFNN
ncbi:MAG: hypothetical protein KAX15_04010 [Candidatus Omnitrophica bacterium]|nr:hypothetical protein [Candidatus Omnitrophota bacterium]